MLLNVSYTDPKVTHKVDAELGKPFTLKERWSMGGIGSPKLFITEASMEIRNLLLLDNNRDSCTIELRPKGILVRFRSLLETYGLAIPYYKLALYKADPAAYTIYRDHYFIKVKADTMAVNRFFKKMMDCRADNSPLPPGSP